MTYVEFSPHSLGIDGVDMEAAANTEYSSSLIDLSGFRLFTAIIVISESGSSAGVCRLRLQHYNDDDTAIGPKIDIVTLVSTATDALNCVVCWSGIEIVGSTNVINGTIGGAINAAGLPGKCKLILEVTTQGTGGTSTADVYLKAQS